MASDEELYAQLLGGDLGAFDALYQRYSGPLLGFALRYVDDRGRAEELVQEAFMSVLREGRRQQQVRRFAPWLYSVTRNLCLNQLRTDHRAAAASAQLQPTIDPAEERPRDSIEDQQSAEQLRRAVDRLPAELAALYAMRARGMSYRSVADTLGIPIGTVKSRLHTLMQRLREEVGA